MLASTQSQLGQVVMRVRRRSNHNKIDFGIFRQVIRRVIQLDTRVVLFGIVVRLGRPLHDGVQFEVGNAGDEGNMKDFGAKAVANNTYVEGF